MIIKIYLSCLSVVCGFVCYFGVVNNEGLDFVLFIK